MPENSKQIWTDGETEALLNIWRSGDIQQMLKGSAMNKQIYSQVSELMASRGFLRTPEQCQNRIKRLKANFRQFLEGRRYVPPSVVGGGGAGVPVFKARNGPAAAFPCRFQRGETGIQVL